MLKFLLPVSLLIMFTSFSLSFFFIRHETATVKSERRNYSDSLARNLAYNSEYGTLTRNTEMLDNLVNGVLKEKDVAAVMIFDSKGNVLINEGETEELVFESNAPIITKVIKANKKNASADIGDDLFFSEQNNGDGREEIIGQVRVFTSLVDMQNKLSELKRRIIEITLIVIIIAIAITFFLVKKITSPLKELVLATKIISDGDLTHKVKVMTNDEIGKLSISFNKMTEELSRTVVSKDYVDNIIKSMIDTLIVTNPDATIRTINQATIDLLGYSESELLGKPLGIFFAENPEMRASAQKPWVDNLIEKGTLQNSEANYIAKDGRIIPVMLSGSVMKSENGNIQGFVYIALDITERKRAEEMVRQSEERYRNLVETAPDIIYSISIKDGRFISLNPAFESITGWKRAEWIGKYFNEIIHPDDLPLAVETTGLIARGKTRPTYALRLLKKSGDFIIGEFTSAPQFEYGEVVAEFG
ncbi:MAG: PAS domain S-box protein, partial [bacterium]